MRDSSGAQHALCYATRVLAKPALLIVNPVSGDAEPNEEKVPRITAALAAGGLAVEVVTTTEEAPAELLAKTALGRGVTRILVGGGDGTVSAVARELIHQDATLGVIPVGTFNNFARSLGILPDLAEACRIITDGHTEAIDVGLANDTDYFFEAAGAGLDAALFPLGEEIKSGRWSRAFHAFALALNYDRPTFEITFDRPVAEARTPPRPRPSRMPRSQKTTLRRQAFLAVAANGPFYGSGFAVAPGARLRDGQLTVSIYRRFSRLELARHFWSINRGTRRYHPKLETYTAAALKLEARTPQPVHLDGQPFGHTPVNLRAVPAALRVFRPTAAARAESMSTSGK